jgi:hypothetical protein
MGKGQAGKKMRNAAVILGVLYSAYLLKTLMGINISTRYSAAGILKVPLRPIRSHSTELCQQFPTLCKIRSKIKYKYDRLKLKQICSQKQPSIS